ncbi:MAG: peptidylprolyl isomerase [Acidimicrobiia bacterium]
MKKLAIAGTALAVLLAACSSSGGIVASVNDVEISRIDVESMVRDAGRGFTEQDFATYLSVVIQWEATQQAAYEQLGLEVTEQEVDDRVDQLVVDFSAGATIDEYLQSVNASESGIRLYATQLILQDAIQEELSASVVGVTDEDVANELRDFPLDWTRVCASHILVATQDEARDVQSRLESGENFADLAIELSTDAASGANGGDLGCAPPSGYVPPFADATMSAEVGVVTEPVETEFGYHLILVNERTEAPPEQVRLYLEQLANSNVVDDWFAAVIEAASVTVDETVGEWVTDPAPQVLVAN